MGNMSRVTLPIIPNGTALDRRVFIKGVGNKAFINEEYLPIVEKIASTMSALHNVAGVRKDKFGVEVYDGTGRVHIPSIPKILHKTHRLELAQLKRKKPIVKRPDVILMWDISGSMSSIGYKTSVLMSSLARIFFRRAGTMTIITIGNCGTVYRISNIEELDEFAVSVVYNEGTNYDAAFRCLGSSNLLDGDNPKIVILISDGHTFNMYLRPEKNSTLMGKQLIYELSLVDERDIRMANFGGNSINRVVSRLKELELNDRFLFRAIMINRNTNIERFRKSLEDDILDIDNEYSQLYLDLLVRNSVLISPYSLSGLNTYNRIVESIMKGLAKLSNY